MKTFTFDNGEDFTSDAVRRALAGEKVESFIDPELMRMAQDILAAEERKARTAAPEPKPQPKAA